jgi:MoaA/NifB/PqqE/SkfB family radical SAM enzyme
MVSRPRIELPDPKIDPSQLNPLHEAEERLRQKQERARKALENPAPPPRAPLHFRIPEALYRAITWKAWKTQYNNYHWAVIWDVQLECNLHCIYCLRIPDATDERGEPFKLDSPLKMVDKLIELRPRFILVTGGEPTLMPELARHLERIKKEADNPYITLNTHMIRPMKIFDELIPHIDAFHVSMDSLGPGNRANRGVEGKKLIERLRSLWDKTRNLGRPFPMTVVSVVTLNTYKEVPEMIDKIREISPDIFITITSMEPFNHPLSVTAHPEILTPFIQLLEQLKEEHGNISIDIPHLEKPKTEQEGVKLKPYINCVRQYFRTQLTPFGENLYCKPNRFIYYFNAQAEQAKAKKDSRMMWKIAYRAARSLLFPKYTTRCYFPCKCELSTESLLRVKDKNAPELNQPIYQGRFTEEDIQRALPFIKRFNPDFDESFFKNMRRQR